MFMVPGAGQALSPSLEADGDRFIGEDFVNDTWLIEGTANINGDLTIRAGGVVTVTNGVLNFRSWDGHINQLIIEDGGQLILRNSVIKAENMLYQVTYALGVLVRNNGILYAENSELTFDGKILVDDATFIASGTTIAGPLFTAMSSQVELYDSELIESPGMPMLEELTYPYSFADSYNQSLDVTYLFERNPDTVSTGQDVADVQMNDSANVTLANGQTLTTTGFDIGGLIFDEGEAQSVILKAEYKTADTFVSGTPDSFEYAEYLAATFTTAGDMDIVETYDPVNPAATNHEMVLSQDLTGLSLSSIDLSVLRVNVTNTKAAEVYIDRIWVEVKLTIPAYHNITIAGTSEFTAVNTLLGANYLNYSMPAYSKLVVSGAAQANLYGVQVQGEFYAEGVGPYQTQSKELTFIPSIIGSNDTTIETDVYGLLLDEGYTPASTNYQIDGTQVM
ncbi:MAG: hypothetical protein MIO90_04375, partial [Methanomassiliicoccales archaeon]|nr:hypothetical protein [Methanomassiliicoccales archaeon]